MKITLLRVAITLITLTASAQNDPATMPKLGTVSPRFQSYNIEMVEIIGGRFWKPYASQASTPAASASGTPGGIDPSLFEQRAPIDLTNPRLRKLAAALGPAYVRVSGTWANTVYFQDSETPASDTAPVTPPGGFNGVLTRPEWHRVVDFSKAVDAPIVTSFATSMGTRDASGTWTAAEAEKFLSYNRSIGGSIVAAEFMNEPTFAIAAGVPKGYDAAAYGRDFAVFKPFFRKSAPGALLLGPGSVGEGIEFVPVKLLPSKDLLAASGPDPVDVFSYHFYGGVSERCSAGMGGKAGTTPTAALTEDWLRRSATVEAFYASLRDTYAPGKPIWLTETGQTACGGDRWASTFLDSFRYLDQLGTLARLHVQVVMHNTLAASDYGLIDEKTLTPRPDYWAALLWHNLMGVTVLDAGESPTSSTHIYAQCMKDHTGGVTLLALNLDQTQAITLKLSTPAQRYTLTGNLMSHSVDLNNRELALTSAGNLPTLTSSPVAKGSLNLPTASITFLTFAAANNPACK